MALPYTPEFLESLRRRYEETRESLNSIGAEFGLDPETVSRIARRSGWRMRSRMRHLPQHMRLAEAARATAESSTARPRESGDPNWIPACAGMSGNLLSDGERGSALDRFERLVLNELAIEEAQRAALGTAPRPPAEAAHKARAYATLLQTLQAIERARNGEPSPAGSSNESTDDIARDMPGDLDEFRLALARRIDAFVAGRTDASDVARGGGPEMVDAAR